MMTIKEIFIAIKENENLVMGKKIGDAGHSIKGFGIDMVSPGQYELYVLGEDLRSYTSIVKMPLTDWLKENGL